jgi:hypothetical protein
LWVETSQALSDFLDKQQGEISMAFRHLLLILQLCLAADAILFLIPGRCPFRPAPLLGPGVPAASGLTGVDFASRLPIGFDQAAPRA